MIHDLSWGVVWESQYRQQVLPILRNAHRDLSNIVMWLRDTGVDIWTESPSDSTKLTANRQHYSLEGWRVHFRTHRQVLAAFNTANGAALQTLDANAKTATDGFLSSTATMAGAFNACVNKYKDGSGNLVQVRVSQADRDALATAIEAELEA